METKDIAKLVGAMLAGALIGTTLGILFAPNKGCKTRRKIMEGASNMTRDMRKKIRKEVEALRQKAEELEEMAMGRSE